MNGTCKTRKSFATHAARAGKLFARKAVALPAVPSPPPARAQEADLSALRREQGVLHQAIFEAAQVQRKLCAPRDLRRCEFEIAGEMFPVRHLSGDFYKVFGFGNEVGLALGDIAGKGLSSGLWLTHLMGLLRICTREHTDPAAASAAINRELCEEHGEPPMTALFLGRVNPQTGELVYCNAGQPGALLLRKSGAVETLQLGGPMLGAIPQAKFETGRVILEAGDTLVAFSDGVVECCNAKDEEFGSNRLAAAAAAAGGVAANRALFSTLGAVLDFAGGRPPGDDLTLLVVHRRAAAGAEVAARPVAADFSAPRRRLLPAVQAGTAARSGIGIDQ
ncbi:MAG: serine/threonine-protein phosphatase [Acidobacteria bacterium]|nr:serine/threonine-protein phosphatase [Acidobacteriota bacterium]MCL5287153.1 serine/threonine-protein phosphatase [Acidobacteriota bacterium]